MKGVAFALMAAAVAMGTGCASLPAPGGGPTARVHEGSRPAAAPSIGEDIREILVAGGLDPSDPAAPMPDTLQSEIASAAPARLPDAALAAAQQADGRASSSAAVLAMAPPAAPARPTPLDLRSAEAVVLPSINVAEAAPAPAPAPARPASAPRRAAAPVPAPRAATGPRRF